MPYENEGIIDELYKLYEQPMYHTAYGILHDEYLAEDAVHEAFLRLIRNRAKITDPTAPSARSYVYKTLKSAALDIYRARKEQREKCVELNEALENTVADAENFGDITNELLAELPPKYASVVRCLFIDALTVRETSAVLNISESLVRKRCERARKLLKSCTEYKKEIRYER